MKISLKKIISSLAIFFIPLVLNAQEVDTLTSSQCNNPEQIVTRLNSMHIEYIMHDYELNIKTIKGYLYNNGASKPYLRKYQSLRGLSFASAGLGLGLIVTNAVMKKPIYSPMGLGGVSLVVLTFPFYFKSNDKFRRGIYEYNKSICTGKSY